MITINNNQTSLKYFTALIKTYFSVQQCVRHVIAVLRASMKVVIMIWPSVCVNIIIGKRLNSKFSQINEMEKIIKKK